MARMPSISIKVEVWQFLRSNYNESNYRKKWTETSSQRISVIGIESIVGGGGAPLVLLYLLVGVVVIGAGV